MQERNHREGFWRSDHEPLLPRPKPRMTPWKGQREFLVALAKVERKARGHHCKGSSECRVCEATNGSVTYEYNGWEWPEGLRHYVEAHNVRPSLAFQEMILDRRVGDA